MCVIYLKMRKSYMNFLIFLIVGVVFSSCSDNSNLTADISGQLATINVKVREESPQEISTRAFDEASISDVHILVYNSNGNLVSQQYTTGNSATFTTRTGANCTIYAIANTNDAFFFSGATASTISKLQTLISGSISTIDGVISGERLLMTGSISDVTINGGLTTQTISGLAVKRMTARINLNVTAATGITITKYRVYNLPNRSFLVHRPNANENIATDTAIGDDATFTYFNSSEVTVNASSLSTFFYMYENRRGGRATVNNGTGTLTNQREKSTYAPTGATYVEITAKGTTFSSVYRIFLGADNSQNYNIKRNVNYTYNITLSGAMSYDTRVSTSILITPTIVAESNCYMVTPGNAIRIPISRANTAIAGSIPDLSKNWDAALLWTDSNAGLSASGAIENVVADFTNGGIIVKAGSSQGNGVVVVKKTDGTILWSWHVWVTSYNPNTTGQTYTEKGYVWMDRNLGAKNATKGDAGSFGFFYQWGRKDPFPGPNANIAGNMTPIKIYDRFGNVLAQNSIDGFRVEKVANTVTNYLESSIRYPMTFYTGNANNDLDWYSYFSGVHNDYLWQTSASAKNIYDPCPTGWRIINDNLCWSNLPDAWNYTYLGQEWSIGWYPAPGHPSCDDGSFAVGSGFYWTSGISGTKGLYLDYYPVSPPTVTWTHGGGPSYRATGASERCVKDY